MKRAVLVNGVPASGKSSVARLLAHRLGAPRLELDAVKEVLFDVLGHRDADRGWGRALGEASAGTIWTVIAGFPPDSTVVVDAWLRTAPHAHVVRGLERAGVDRWVEIWCHAKTDVLAARYAARERHPGHPAAAEYLDELRQLASEAGPTALSEVLEIDTSTPGGVDIDAVVEWVQARLQRSEDPGG